MAASAAATMDLTENKKRWAVVGIALNKVVIASTRPLLKDGIEKEYENLKTHHSIDTQIFGRHYPVFPSGGQAFQYKNINGNQAVKDKKYWDYNVMSAIDLGRLCLAGHMAHFTAFDDSCDGSAVLTLLGCVPSFHPQVQGAAKDVRSKVKNEWAHCNFGEWDERLFHSCFRDMEKLLNVMALNDAEVELKEWEDKGVEKMRAHGEVETLVVSSSVDQAIKEFQEKLKQMAEDQAVISETLGTLATKIQVETIQQITVGEVVKQLEKSIMANSSNVENQYGDVPVEITARGPEAEHAYRKALLEGKVKMYRGRIMLIGQDRAGKTSLKKSLLGLPFNVDEPSTEGIEVDPSSFEVDVEQVISWQRLHDVMPEGSQSEHALAKLIVEELNKAATKVNYRDDVDPTSDEKPPEKRDTLEKSKVSNAQGEAFQDLDIVQEKTAQSENTGVLGVSQPMPEELTRLVEDYLKGYRSIKKETVLDVWDLAGQHLYYATHPVFFSSRTIYVLVYNLSKDPRELAEPCVRQGVHSIKLDNNNKETNLENLISWLVTVHGMQSEGKRETNRSQLKYRRPPVVIVGTHADIAKLPAQEAHDLLCKAMCGKTYDEHVIRPFYTVDNNKSSEDPGVQGLKNCIAQLLESEPYMGETLPAKWLNFEKAINARVNQNVYYMSLEEVREIAESECFITDPIEVDTMLNFYHYLRVIVKHGSTVVLQSEWLIELFRSLITIRTFHDMDPVLAKYWKSLQETGVLHKTLIDHMCGGCVQNAAAQKDLLSMMEHYGIIAKFKCSPQANGGSTEEYFVPAQLTSSPSSLAKTCPGPDDPCPLFFHFTDGFVPHGLFSRLVSRLILQFSEAEFIHRPPKLFCNAARFVVGLNRMYDLYLVCHKTFIKVTLRTLPSQAPTIQCDVPIQLRMLLEETLLELSRDWEWLRGMSYELCVQCDPCTTNCDGCENHGQVGCPDDECMHLIPVDGHPLVCERRFGGDSYFTVPGLQLWFAPKRDMTKPPRQKELSTAQSIPAAGGHQQEDAAGDSKTDVEHQKEDVDAPTSTTGEKREGGLYGVTGHYREVIESQTTALENATETGDKSGFDGGVLTSSVYDQATPRWNSTAPPIWSCQTVNVQNTITVQYQPNISGNATVAIGDNARVQSTTVANTDPLALQSSEARQAIEERSRYEGATAPLEPTTAPLEPPTAP